MLTILLLSLALQAQTQVEADFPFTGVEMVHLHAPISDGKPHDHRFDDHWQRSAFVAGSVILGGAAFDYTSTEYALKHCHTCVEANPFGQGKTQRIGLQVFYSIGTTIAHYALKRLGAHTKAKILLIFAGTLKVAAGTNNVIHGIRGK